MIGITNNELHTVLQIAFTSYGLCYGDIVFRNVNSCDLAFESLGKIAGSHTEPASYFQDPRIGVQLGKNPG